MAESGHRHGTLLIRNVRLAHPSGSAQDGLYDIACERGVTKDIAPRDLTESQVEIETVDGERGLLLPSLAHAHIHLDKCFILDKCSELMTGDFQEALRVTDTAKKQFAIQEDNLYERGKRLVLESVACGVTAMRAHVEVDATVRFSCLDVGLRLKQALQHICDIQLCVFAQDPIFCDDQDGDSENALLLAEAASCPGISAIGSAPYVEPSLAHSKRNVARILDLAEQHNLHADFHLDYNLDSDSEISLHQVLKELRERTWGDPAEPYGHKHVTIGHATRLALLSKDAWRALAQDMNGLPVHFVGLPQSDLYMMGRRDFGDGPSVRGTLPVTQLARELGIEVALAVNNVDNAFTPQGSADPLMLCPLGVAIFQAATPRDCETLLSSVTTTAKRSIGMPNIGKGLMPSVGEQADFVILHGNPSTQSAALNPSYSRTTVKGGSVVATRRGHEWVAPIRGGQNQQ